MNDVKIPLRFSGDQLAGGIYGAVTAMAVITGLASDDTSIWILAGSAVGAPLVLAITYVYAHWIANSHGAEAHTGLRQAIALELPTLIAPVLLAVELVVVYSASDNIVAAAESAMWLGTAVLFVLGFRIARSSGRSMSRSLALGLVDAAIGAALVGIKVAIH